MILGGGAVIPQENRFFHKKIVEPIVREREFTFDVLNLLLRNGFGYNDCRTVSYECIESHVSENIMGKYENYDEKTTRLIPTGVLL